MNNMSAIALKIQPYLFSSGIQTIYVSTDSCEVIPSLREPELLGLQGTVIHSPCDRGPSPSRGHPEHTPRLLAEIEMMRHGMEISAVLSQQSMTTVTGTYFFGLMRSNLCSLVYLLRNSIEQKNTINLVACRGCNERIEVFTP